MLWKLLRGILTGSDNRVKAAVRIARVMRGLEDILARTRWKCKWRIQRTDTTVVMELFLLAIEVHLPRFEVRNG